VLTTDWLPGVIAEKVPALAQAKATLNRAQNHCHRDPPGQPDDADRHPKVFAVGVPESDR
jgi:hypothetical protein